MDDVEVRRGTAGKGHQNRFSLFLKQQAVNQGAGLVS